MQRVPGYGHKREILRGLLRAANVSISDKPCFARPGYTTAERHAVIVGAGLAGWATAAYLAPRGWKVTVLERHAAAAQEGSGNPQGVPYLKLSPHGTALAPLVGRGISYQRRLLR